MLHAEVHFLPTRKISPQSCNGGLVQRHHASFLELGFANQQALRGYIRYEQVQCFGDSQSRRGQQADQCRISYGAKRVCRDKVRSSKNEMLDVDPGVDVGDTAGLT